MDLETFKKALLDLNIPVTLEKLEKLEKYYELLISFNEKINLTAITDKNEVYLKHFYDSLTIVKVIDLEKQETLCDVGTGAGFPGVVLKIFYPHLKLTLVDALNKRIIFLQELVKELGLENVEFVHARAEEYALKNREKFDVVTARAVASLNVLLEYTIPMVKVSKYFIAMKANENLENYKNAFNLLDVETVINQEFLLPIENSKRMLIKFKKNRVTDKKYPRRFSEIKKKPL